MVEPGAGDATHLPLPGKADSLQLLQNGILARAAPLLPQGAFCRHLAGQGRVLEGSALDLGKEKGISKSGRAIIHASREVCCQTMEFCIETMGTRALSSEEDT